MRSQRPVQSLTAMLIRVSASPAAPTAWRNWWNFCAPRWRSDFCYWNYPLVELAGKTFGVIGFGRIGRTFAGLARAFGMRVLIYDHGSGASGDEAELVSLEQLLARSDVVSLHCPLTAENTGMINRERIALMKDGALLLNTARGPLIDEQAAADVFEMEPPIPEDHPLVTAKNTLLTPHVAFATKEALERRAAIVFENAFGWLRGEIQNEIC